MTKTVRVKNMHEKIEPPAICREVTIAGVCERPARWFVPNGSGHPSTHVCHGHYSLMTAGMREIYWRYRPETS